MEAVAIGGMGWGMSALSWFASPIINKLLNYVFEGQPGTRRLELDQARIEYGTPEEQTLNFLLVSETFMQLSAMGFGFLSSIWATLLLVRLEKEDFWFVTVIILIQSIRYCKLYQMLYQRQWRYKLIMMKTGTCINVDASMKIWKIKWILMKGS